VAEQVNIKVLIDATKSSKTLQELENNVENLNDALNEVPEGSQAFDQLTEAIEDSSDQALELAVNIDKSKATIGELERSIEVLSEELKGVERGSNEFGRLSSELIEANRQLKNVELSLEALDTEQVASELGSVTGAVGDVTASFILLGGEGNETLEEIGRNLEIAIGLSTGVKGAIEGIQSGIKLYKNLGDQIKQSNVFIKLATVSQSAWNVVQGVFSKVVGGSTKAVNGFKVALISTGIGALIVLIGTLVAQWENITKALSFTTDAQNRQNEVSSQAIEKAGEELSAIDKLQKAIQSGNLSREQQIDAVKDLQEQYPDLLQNIDAEKITREELNEALRLNAELIELKAQADAIAELRAESYKQILQEQADAQTGANVGIIDYIQSLGTGVEAQDLANFKTKERIQGLKDETKAYDELDRGIQDSINSLEVKLGVDREAEEARKKEEEDQKKAEAEAKKRQAEAKRRAEEKKRQAEEQRKAEEKRLSDLAILEEEFFQKSLATDEEREARRLTLAFEAQRKRIESLVKDDEKLKTLLKQNEEFFQKDLQAIEDKYSKIDEDKRRELNNKKIQSSRNVAIIEEQIRLESLTDQERAGEEGLKILNKINDLKIEQLRENRDIELQNTELTAEERLEIEKKYLLEEEKINNESRRREAEADAEANKSKAERRKALKDELISLAFDTAQAVSDLAFEIAEQEAQRESEMRLENLDNTFNAEQDRLNQKVEDGLITQAEADRQSAELEKKKNAEALKEQKRLFTEQKKRQKTQAVINGALAFTNALATTQPLVPAGLIAGAGVLISTGVQIAKIESQKFAKGGILSGKSHAQGGIKTPFGELEGGEAVINKRSTNMFKGTLSRINEAGGGVRFASGGILGQGTSQGTTQEGTDLGGILTTLNDRLSQPIRSFVVESDVSETQNRVSRLEKNADL
jgi:hypothetical protein